MDEARQPGGDAGGDRGADGGQPADRPAPLPDWSQADTAWPSEDAERTRRSAWAEPPWNWAGPAWSAADQEVTPAPEESADRRQDGPGSDSSDTDRGNRVDPWDVPEPAKGRAAVNLRGTIDAREPLDARRRGSAWARLAPEPSWADLSARYSDLLPLSAPLEDREGQPSNGSGYASPSPEPVQASWLPADPPSPPTWPGAGPDPTLADRTADPESTPPAIPAPRSAPPAHASDPLTAVDAKETTPPGPSGEDRPVARSGPGDQPSVPAAWHEPRTTADPAGPGSLAPARTQQLSVRPRRSTEHDDPQRGTPTASPPQRPPQPIEPSFVPASAGSAEPVGWTSPGVFVSHRQAQLDEESAGHPHRAPSSGDAEHLPPSPAPTAQPAPPPAPWPAGAQSIRPAEPTAQASAEPRQEADDPTRVMPPAPVAGSLGQPVNAPANVEPEVLPQRVPTEPDVPTVPEPGEDPTAETPELARIATHLRQSDSALPRERPEGFDVQAILAAVREVPGVADASLRTTPAGAHKLRLDLAEGADSAEVSRQVARLLQERMGLAAAPPDPDAAAWPHSAAAGPSPVNAEPSPSSTAPAHDDAVSGEHIVPRRRRSGSHRGRATVAPQPATGLYGTSGPHVGSAPVAAASPGAQLTRAESAPSRPLRPGARPGPRLVIDHLQVSTSGLKATVEVRLSADGRLATGVAAGPAVDGYVLRLCATATAAAVDDLLRTGAPGSERGRCVVEHAAVLSLGGCDVATVVVLLVCDGWVDQLAGSALVSGDPRAAMVRATLAAINRRLEALLS